MAPDPNLEPDVTGDDVEAMIDEQTETRVRKNSNVFIAINSGGLLILAVWVGIYVQKISDLDTKVQGLQSVAVLSTKIDVLTTEVNRLRDELDRLSRRYTDDRNAR